jgi:hypothetical protein
VQFGLGSTQGEEIMKRLVLASALLAGTISTVSAVEVWQGDMFITAASAGCAATPHGVGSFYRSVYRPNGVEDNGNFEAISFVTPRAVFRVAVNGSFPAAGSYFAAGIGSSFDQLHFNVLQSVDQASGDHANDPTRDD